LADEKLPIPNSKEEESQIARRQGNVVSRGKREKLGLMELIKRLKEGGKKRKKKKEEKRSEMENISGVSRLMSEKKSKERGTERKVLVHHSSVKEYSVFWIAGLRRRVRHQRMISTLFGL